jgi:hypothetical protein
MPYYRYDRRTAAGPGSAEHFVEMFQSHLKIGDRYVVARVEASWGPKKVEDVYVNYINLPKGIGGAGGGAEAENNRMSFWVRGFGEAGAPSPTGRVRVEMATSALPREFKLRAKAGPPDAIAKYLADFLSKVAAEVPPKFTHTDPATGKSKYKI